MSHIHLFKVSTLLDLVVDGCSSVIWITIGLNYNQFLFSTKSSFVQCWFIIPLTLLTTVMFIGIFSAFCSFAIIPHCILLHEHHRWCSILYYILYILKWPSSCDRRVILTLPLVKVIISIGSHASSPLWDECNVSHPCRFVNKMYEKSIPTLLMYVYHMS